MSNKKLIIDEYTTLVFRVDKNTEYKNVCVAIIDDKKFTSFSQLKNLLIIAAKKNKVLLLIRPKLQSWDYTMLPGDIAELGLKNISQIFKKNLNEIKKMLKKFPKRNKNKDDYFYGDIHKSFNSGSIWNLVFQLRLNFYDKTPNERSKLLDKSDWFRHYYDQVIPDYKIGKIKIIPVWVNILKTKKNKSEDNLLNIFSKFTGAKIIKSYKTAKEKDLGFVKKIILNKQPKNSYDSDKITLIS